MEELHSRHIRSRAAMRVDKEWKGTSSDSTGVNVRTVKNSEHIEYEI